jgi:outer membrane murein-binding lipoprotein Lpp
MSEPIMEIDWRAVAFYLWGGIVSLLGLLGASYKKKIDRNTEELIALRAAVERVEMGNKAVIDQMAATQSTILSHLLGGRNER